MSRLRFRLPKSALSRLLAGIFRRTEQSAVDTLSAHLEELFPEIRSKGAQLSSALVLAGVNEEPLALAKAIFGPDLQKVPPAKSEGTMAYLRRRVQRDFEDGRLIVVDGWHLSQTEARLLALIASR
jgi:hypothetical protein